MIERREVKNLGEKAIRLLAVIELIVMRAGIAVLVKIERVFLPIQFEKAPDIIVNVRLDQGRAEAAVVLGVVDEQRRTGGAHGPHVLVIPTPPKLPRVLPDSLS